MLAKLKVWLQVPDYGDFEQNRIAEFVQMVFLVGFFSNLVAVLARVVSGASPFSFQVLLNLLYLFGQISLYVGFKRNYLSPRRTATVYAIWGWFVCASGLYFLGASNGLYFIPVSLLIGIVLGYGAGALSGTFALLYGFAYHYLGWHAPETRLPDQSAETLVHYALTFVLSGLVLFQSKRSYQKYIAELEKTKSFEHQTQILVSEKHSLIDDINARLVAENFLKRQTQFQWLISAISVELLSSDIKLDTTLQNCLDKLSRFFKADQAFLTLLSNNVAESQYQTGNLVSDGFSLAALPFLQSLVGESRFVQLDLGSQLPPKMQQDQQYWRELGVDFVAINSFAIDKRQQGIFVFLFKEKVDLSGLDTHLLMLGVLVAAAIRRQQEHRQLLRYKYIFSASREVSYFINADRIILEVNEAYCQLAKKSRTEIVGQPVQSVWDESYFTTYIEPLLKRAFEGEYVHDEGWRLRQGKEVYVVANYGPIYDEEGKLLGVAASGSVETKVKEAEKMLKRQASLLDQIEDRISIVDKNYRYIYSNEANLRLHGVSSEELLGSTVAQIVGKDRFERRSRVYIDRALAGEDVSYQHLYTGADGIERIFELSLTPYYEAGEIKGAIFHSRDLTEKIQLERAQAELAHALEASEEGFILYDSELRVRYFNQRFLALSEVSEFLQLGQKLEDVLRYRISKGLIPEAIGQEDDWIAQLISISRQKTLTTEHKTEKGWLQYSSSPTVEGGLLVFVRDISEKKQADEHVRFQARMIDMLNDAVIATDHESRISSWNSAAERVYGWSAAEVIGKPFLEILPTHYFATTENKMKDQVLEHSKWVGEVKHFHKDGRQLEIAVSVASLLDEQGTFNGLVGVNRDITEQKLVQEQIRAQAELFEIVSEAIIATDNEFVITAWNSSAERIYGWTAEEALGQDLRELVPTEYGPGQYKKVYDGFMGQGFWRGEVKQISKQGKKIDIAASITSRSNGQGEFIGTVAVCQDITEQKLVQEQIRAQAELFEIISDAIIVTDKEFRISFWNLGAEKIYGWSADEVIGEVLADIFPEDYNDSSRKEIEAHYSVEGRWRGELLHRHKQGHFFRVSTSVNQIYDANGELTGHVALNRDISKEYQLKDEQRRLLYAFENSRDAFVLYDGEEKLVTWNERIFEFIPYLQDVLKPGMSYREVLEHRRQFELKDEDPEDWIEKRLQLFREYDGVLDWQSAQGKYLQSRFNKTPEGGILFIVTDVTELKQATKSSDRLYHAIEQSSDAFMLCDANEKLVTYSSRVNEYFPELTQFLQMGQSTTEIFEYLLLQGVFPGAINNEEPYREALVKLMHETFGFDLQTNRERWLRLRSYKTPQKETLLVATDITESKMAELTLQRQAQDLRQSQTIANVTSVRTLWDSVQNKSVKTEFSSQLRVLLDLEGSAPEELNFSPEAFIEFVHPEDRIRVEQDFAALIQNGGTRELEYRIISKKGREKIVFARRSVVARTEDSVHILGALQDVSEQRQTQLALDTSATFRHQLLDLTQQLLEIRLEQTFYQQILEQAVKMIPGAQAGSLIVKVGKHYQYAAALGFDLEALQTIEFEENELYRNSSDFEAERVRFLGEGENLLISEEKRHFLEEVGRVKDIKVTLAVPIIVRETAEAYFYLDNFDSAAAFSDEALELARLFATQVASVWQRFRLEASLEEERRSLRSQTIFRAKLAELIYSAMQGEINNSFLERVLLSAIEVIPDAEAGSLLIKNEEGVFRFVAAVGHDKFLLEDIFLKPEEIYRDLNDPRPLVVRNISNEPIPQERREKLNEAARSDDIKAALSVPIYVEGEARALLSLDNFGSAEAFKAEAVDMASIFASQIGTLWQRFLLEEKLQLEHKQVEEQSFFRMQLNNLVRDLMSGDLDEAAYQRVLYCAVDAIPGAQAGSFIRLNDADKLEFLAAYHFDIVPVKGEQFSYEELGFDKHNKHPRVVRGFEHYITPERKALLEQIGGIADIKATLILPIMLHDRAIAYLNLDNLEDAEAFGRGAISMGQVFANQLAVLWQRFELEQDLKDERQHLSNEAQFRTRLNELIQTLMTQELDESFFQTVLQASLEVIPGAESGSIALKQEAAFYFVAAVGYDLQVLGTVAFERDDFNRFRQRPTGPEVVYFEGVTDPHLSEEKRRALLQSGSAASIQSTLSTTISSHGEVIAFLHFDNHHSSRAFSQEALHMAELLANQIGALWQRLKLEQNLKLERLRLSRETSFRAELNALMQDFILRDLDEDFYQIALEKAVEIIPGAEAGSVILQVDGGFEFAAGVGFDINYLASSLFSKEEIASQRSWTEPEVLYFRRDHFEASLSSEKVSLIHDAGPTHLIAATLSVPIRYSGYLIAFFNLDSFDPAFHFGDEEIMMAQAFAYQIAVLWHRHRLEQGLKQERQIAQEFKDKLKALHEIGFLLSREPDSDSILRNSIQFGRDFLDFDRLSLYLMNDASHLQGSYGTSAMGHLQSESHRRFSFSADQKWAAVKAHGGLTLHLKDVELYDGKEVLGRGWQVFSPVRDGDNILAWLVADNLLNQRELKPYELELLELFGSTIARHLSQKAAQAKLYEREAQFRTLFEHAPEAILILDIATGGFFDANSQSEKLFGYPKVELLEKTIASLSPDFQADGLPSESGDDRSYLKRALSGEYVMFEWLHKDASGRVFPAEVRLVKLPHSSKTLIRIGIIDITDRKQAEINLVQSEQRFRFLFDNAPIGAKIVDKDLRVVQANRALADMLGYSHEELLKLSIPDIIHPEDFGKNHERVLDYAERPGEILNLEQRYRHKDGHYLTALSSITYEGQEGDLKEVSQVVDISERKALEQALEQQRSTLAIKVAERTFELEEARNKAVAASQAKSEFLASMSHELRTPLNAIIGFAQVLGKEYQLDQDQQNLVTIIQRNGVHLLELINDVLEFARLEANKSQLELSVVDIRKMITLLDEMFRLRVEQKGLEFRIVISDQVPSHAVLDDRKVRQVLLNLLSNAVKFTDKGFIALTVELEPGARHLIFSLEDTGQGIDGDEMDLVFEAFSQTRSGRESQQGTGLGLSISRKFVEMMSGTIKVQSERNRGSRFSVSLPLTLAEELSAHLSIKDERQPRLLALVSADLQEPLREAMKGQYELVFAQQNDIQWLEQEVFQTLIIDLELANVDPFALIQRVKKEEPFVAVALSKDGQGSGALLAAGFQAVIERAKFDELKASLSEGAEPVAAKLPDLVSLRNRVKNLSEDALDNLTQSIHRLDVAEIEQVVSDFESYEPDLALYIRHLLQDFAFDELTKLLSYEETL
ncbi:MAG: PAS domain S-box protein [Trueperaceae bacterium]|nr:PAS domain S-box protein [Trueperaceae bacterium]